MVAMPLVAVELLAMLAPAAMADQVGANLSCCQLCVLEHACTAPHACSTAVISQIRQHKHRVLHGKPAACSRELNLTNIA